MMIGMMVVVRVVMMCFRLVGFLWRYAFIGFIRIIPKRFGKNGQHGIEVRYEEQQYCEYNDKRNHKDGSKQAQAYIRQYCGSTDRQKYKQNKHKYRLQVYQ